MKKLVLFFSIIIMLSTRGNAQYFIAGNIQNDKSEPVPYANIVLAHTKTSVSSDSLGNFIILSTAHGGLLTVSAVGYETTIEKVQRQGDTTYISIKMQRPRNVLETVTITAGTINTNNSGGSKLSTADILETAGANADIAKALQTLPGFQKNGLETGLMVRGGDVSETAIVIDNSIVQNPFFSAIPGVSQNSRFGAFQFKGISYSSGGYSARYDQALSSILELNTLDLPTTDNINLGLNFAGIYASASKKWDKSGLTISSHYINLKYFYNWAKTNINFYKAPEGPSLALNYSWRITRGGLLKFTTSNIISSSGSRIPDPFNYGNRINYALKNMNTFSNLSFKQAFNKLSLFTSVAFSYNKDDINWNDQSGDNINKRLQARVEAKYYLIRDFSLLTGFEVQNFNINRLQLGIRQFYSEDQLGGYIEGLYSYGKWLSVRPGLRFSYSHISSDTKPSPRLAVNLLLNSDHQISFSGGSFYQNQEDIYLLSGYRGKMQREPFTI